MKSDLIGSVISLSVMALIVGDLVSGASSSRLEMGCKKKRWADGGHGSGHSIMHSHMSRKVFDRACAASKDTIDEIIGCFTSSDQLLKSIKPELAAQCYKDSFGGEFDHKEVMKHKEMICNNREKFEDMTACIYRKTTESLNTHEIDKLTEAMVDVGMCIINALD